MVEIRRQLQGQVVILLPEQCRAARGLLNWTQVELATIAGVSRSTVRDFEGELHELQRSSEVRLMQALENAGVMLLPPQNGEGPGVRLIVPLHSISQDSEG